MKVSCGTDIIRITRITKALERSGGRLLDRIWTKAEQNLCRSSASLAVRFAAKEAVSKALGTGIGPQGVRWTDIEILRKESGAPDVYLHNAAAIVYKSAGAVSISVSLSHEGDLAQAFCVILADKNN